MSKRPTPRFVDLNIGQPNEAEPHVPRKLSKEDHEGYLDFIAAVFRKRQNPSDERSTIDNESLWKLFIRVLILRSEETQDNEPYEVLRHKVGVLGIDRNVPSFIIHPKGIIVSISDRFTKQHGTGNNGHHIESYILFEPKPEEGDFTPSQAVKIVQNNGTLEFKFENPVGTAIEPIFNNQKSLSGSQLNPVIHFMEGTQAIDARRKYPPITQCLDHSILEDIYNERGINIDQDFEVGP